MPKRKVKVFRIWKWLQSLGEIDDYCAKVIVGSIESGWPQQCEGKTKEECMELCLTIVPDSWFVEE